MFIIEGSDNLGKTTLAKGIVAKCTKTMFPIRYQHMSRQNSSFNYGSHYRDMMSVHAVQDRFHLGALVWHTPGTLPHSRLRIIEGELLALASYTVILFTSDEHWYREHCKRLAEKEQMFSIDAIIEANQRYREMVEMRSVHFDAAYDIEAGNFPDDTTVAQWISDWMDRLMAREEMNRYV